MEAVLNQVMDALANNMLVRGALGWLGMTLVLRKGDVVRKAVPTVLLVVNVLFEALRLLFPDMVPPASAADAVAAAEASAPWWQRLALAIGSAVVAVGLHSGSKNTKEWADIGFRLIDKMQRR